jgi:hypothetical protein
LDGCLKYNERKVCVSGLSLRKCIIINLVGEEPMLVSRKEAKSSELPEDFKKGTLGFTGEFQIFV